MAMLWRISNRIPSSCIGEVVDDNSWDRLAFQCGEEVSLASVCPVTFAFGAKVARLSKLDDLPNSAYVPLVSSVLAEWLQKHCGGVVQLIPTILRANDGHLDDYKLLNITCRVSALDRSKSRFKYIPGTEQILSFTHVSYLQHCVDDLLLARSTDYLPHLLVAEALVDSMKRDGFSVDAFCPASPP